MALEDIHDGDMLKAVYKSGAILTGPAMVRDDGATCIRLNDGYGVLAVLDYDGRLPSAVASVERMAEPMPLDVPDGEGLWRDGFGGLVVVEETATGSLAATRVNEAGEWVTEGPWLLPNDAVDRLGPYTRVETVDRPIRLTETATPGQLDAASREILNALHPGKTTGQLPADELYWIGYAALHALHAAARTGHADPEEHA